MIVTLPVITATLRMTGKASGRNDYVPYSKMPKWRSVTVTASVLVALAATACTRPDYTPVQDWAATANLAVGYPPSTEPCQSPPGQVPAPPPALRLGDGTRAMQAALATYLSALSTLAADGVLPYREDPFAELAQRAAGTSQEGADAVAKLGALLRKATIDNAQAPQLGATIAEADGSVQALVAALVAAVPKTDAGVAAERRAMAVMYSALEREARDPAAAQAIRDAAVLRDRQLATRAAVHGTYSRILEEVAAGHALLKERASHLSQEETARQVRVARDRLLGAAAPLPALLVVAPGGVACPSTPPPDLPQRAGNGGPSSSASPR